MTLDTAKWLKTLPSHWNCQKIGTLFSERKTKVSDEDYPPLSVTKIGIVPQLATVAKTDASENRKLVCTNDFVINSRSDRKGSCGISDRDGSVSLINIVLTPRSGWNTKYIHYLMRCQPFAEEYYRHGRGIVADLWTTRFNEMKDILLPMPPRFEQEQIGRFLDWKISIINRLIEIKREKVSELNKLKKSLITTVIQKSLNSNIETKDSGIDYIGIIPKNWQLVKLKSLLSFPLQYGANASGTVYNDNLPRYIRITDISIDNKLKDSDKQSLPWESAIPYILKENDILLARSGATVGKSFLYKSEYGPAAFAGYLIKATINSNLALAEYIYQITLSEYYEVWKDRIFIQSTIQNISAEKYNNLPIVLPPLNEQTKIINYINQKNNYIEDALENTEKCIKALIEMKNHIIFDAVTGKIDVRDIKIPE